MQDTFTGNEYWRNLEAEAIDEQSAEVIGNFIDWIDEMIERESPNL